MIAGRSHIVRGAKVRPKGVADDKLVDIPVPPKCDKVRCSDTVG